MTAGSRGPTPRQPQRSATDVTLIFDGGSLGNPGKGYGSFITCGRVETRQPVKLEFAGRRTNNEAEYMTLIEGLRHVLSVAGDDGVRADSLAIRVLSDSQLVVEQVSGRWKVRNEGLKPLHAQARELLARFASWELTWHPRSQSVRYLGH